MGSANIPMHFTRMRKAFFEHYRFEQCSYCYQYSGINVSILYVDFTLEPVHLSRAIVLV